jgi:solute carrier family 35 protein F1/2
MLLDCFTIPFVMGFSYFFLKRKYHRNHLVGVVICLAGLMLLIFSDFLQDSEANKGTQFLSMHSHLQGHNVKGDFFCIIAALLYSISNVSQEYYLQSYSRIEWLSLLGIGGTIFDSIQVYESSHPFISYFSLILERNELASIHVTGSVGIDPF